MELKGFCELLGDASLKPVSCSSKFQPPGQGFAFDIMKKIVQWMINASMPIAAIVVMAGAYEVSRVMEARMLEAKSPSMDLKVLQEIRKITRATLAKKDKMDRAMLSRRERYVQMVGAFATTAVNVKIQKLKVNTTAINLLDQINMKLRDRVQGGDLQYFLDHLHWLDLAAGAALESVK